MKWGFVLTDRRPYWKQAIGGLLLVPMTLLVLILIGFVLSTFIAIFVAIFTISLAEFGKFMLGLGVVILMVTTLIIFMALFNWAREDAGKD